MKEFGFVVGCGGEIVCKSPVKVDFSPFYTLKDSLPLKSGVPKPSSNGDAVKVYVDSYSLLIDVLAFLVNVPKDCKLTITQVVEKDLLGLIRSVDHANGLVISEYGWDISLMQCVTQMM